MRTTWTARLAATALLLTLTACGGSGSSEATQSPTTSATTGPATSPAPSTPTDEPADGCPYLTAAEVTDALGSPTAETAGSVNACFFDPDSGEGPNVMVSRVDVTIDPADYAKQTRALCQGDVTDVDAGDDAFACVLGLGPQGQVYLGRVLITISVSDAADDATGLEAAADLLPLVTAP